MSVDYKAGIAYGWEFSGKEYAEFNEETDYVFEDDFIILDPYLGDSSTFKAIFGIWLIENPCIGTAIPYLTFNEIDKEFNMYDWIKKFESAGYIPASIPAPKHFLVNQVY